MGLQKHDLGTEQQTECGWLTGGSEGTSGATDWGKVSQLCSIYEHSLNLTLSPWLLGALPQVRVRSMALSLVWSSRGCLSLHQDTHHLIPSCFQDPSAILTISSLASPGSSVPAAWSQARESALRAWGSSTSTGFISSGSGGWGALSEVTARWPPPHNTTCSSCPCTQKRAAWPSSNWQSWKTASVSRGRSLVGIGAAGSCRDLVQLISEGRRCPGPCGCSDPAGNWDIESRNCLQTRETTNRDLPPPHDQSPPNLTRVWLECRFWCGPGSGQTTQADRGTAGCKQAPGGQGQWGTGTKSGGRQST